MRLKQKAMIAAGLPALALLALWLAAPGLLATRWTAELRGLGYPQAELAVDDLGWTHATGAFSLGGEEGADRFEADFTPIGLWRGRLSGLMVRALRLSRPVGLSGSGLPADMPLDGPLYFQDARLTLALPGGIGILPLTLDAGFTPGPDGWHGEGQGIVALGATGVPARFTADWRDGGLVAAGFSFTPTPGGPRLSGQGNLRRLATGSWTGDLDVTAASLPDELPDLSLRWKDGQGQAVLDWKGAARLDALLDPDDQGSHRFNAQLRVTDLAAFAARAGQPDPGFTGGPLEVTLSARGFSLAALPAIWPDLSLRLDARDIGLGRGPRDNALSLGATARRIEGQWWLSAAPDQPGALSIPTLGVEAKGLLLTGRAALPLDLDLRAASLRLPWLAPASLAARLRGDPASDLRLEWKATGKDGGAQLSGGIDLDPAGGRLVARLAPLRLESGDTPRLFPGAPLPAGFHGTIAGRLSAGWTDSSTDGSADLLLEGAGLTLPGLRVAGINGVLHFDRLSPLSMPQQSVAIGLFDPGLSLTGGSLGLSMPGDGVLRLVPEPFLWAGQRVAIPPTLFRLGNDHLDLTVDIPATPLSSALAALGVDDLNADGTLIGSIPVLINATGARPGPGALRATTPGRLSLTGGAHWLDAARNDSLALVTRALADYRYRALELSLTPHGSRLSLDGSNPSLYGGYAMPMNLVLAPAPPAIAAPVPAFAADAITAFKARKE
ncbi:intermembrane phospholipid transport protein YdbH family protein [Niveispirillum sp. KHB5.9]|uniref:intermembrane phospholipid transport protein YdbH family protein n=1 Tax=Niveispirillum sp. KHB5.9 TaxID=3400269 RepID=UPI003A89FA69